MILEAITPLREARDVKKHILRICFALILALSMWTDRASAIAYCAWGCSPEDTISGVIELDTNGPGADVSVLATLFVEGWCKPVSSNKTSCTDGGGGSITDAIPIGIDLTVAEGESGTYGFEIDLEYLTNHFFEGEHTHVCPVNKIEVRESFMPFLITGSWKRNGVGPQQESGTFNCYWNGSTDPHTCEASTEAGYDCSDQHCFDSFGNEIPCNE
jgi:hypothetical protein